MHVDDHDRPVGHLPAATPSVLQRLQDDLQQRHSELERILAVAATEIEAERVRLQQLLENVPTGIVEFDGQSCLWANGTFLRLMGRELDDVLGDGWLRTLHPDQPLFGPAVGDTTVMRGTARHVHSDGRVLWCDVSIAAAPLPDRPERIFVSIQDVTEGHEAVRSDLAREARFRWFFDSAAIGSIVTDLDGRVREVNQAYTSTTGYSAEELLGRRLHEVVLTPTGEFDLPGVAQQLHSAGTPEDFEVQVIRRDGAVVWTKVSMYSSVDEVGEPVLVIQLTDVDALHRQQADAEFRASHDELTGLPNRASVLGSLDDLIVSRSGMLAVLLCDLDRFRAVNEVMGHAAGDQLLRQVAQKLRAHVRSADLVARIGGDEFAVVLTGLVSEDEATATAARIQSSFAGTFLVEDEEVTCGVSVGVAILDLAEVGSVEAAAVLDDAGTALQEAKGAGRGNARTFTTHMRETVLRRLQVENELRRALDQGELRLHYQPVVRLADGTRSGYEALVRWEHPVRGLLQPADFLEVAEDSGLSEELDRYVLHEAVGFLARHRDTMVAVNISPRRLDGSFADTVLHELALAGVEARRLAVELVETSLLNVDPTTTRELQALSAMGCGLLIDDFGTGYSALSYLRRLPVTGLKLDRSFVADLPGDADADKIATAVAGLANGFALHSIAEGVETAEQAAHLEAQGWTFAQGWLFGRPCAEEHWYPAELPRTA